MDVNLWGTLLEMSFLLLMPPPPCVCLSVLSSLGRSSLIQLPGAARQGILFPFSRSQDLRPPPRRSLHSHPGPPPGSFVLGIYRVCTSWEGKKRRERGRGAAFHVPWGDHARVEDVTPKQNEPHTRRQRRTPGSQRSAYFGEDAEANSACGGGR